MDEADGFDFVNSSSKILWKYYEKFITWEIKYFNKKKHPMYISQCYE
jgi:hypothetical protein